MRRILLFLVFCSSFGEFGCSFDKIDWPSSPQNTEFAGDNGEHFDAKVNGTDWWPLSGMSGWDFPGYPSPINASFDSVNTTLRSFYLKVERKESPESTLQIIADSIPGLGSYDLGDSLHGRWASFYQVDTLSDRTVRRILYSTNKLNTGVLKIEKIDSSKRSTYGRTLISGSVSFDAANGDSVIHLREGVFTASYR